MKHNKKLVRVIAIVLAVLLAGGVVVGALLSALAEENPPIHEYTLEMTYMEEAQALHIRQRLVYFNGTSDALDRVIFYAAPNMMRRADALMYEEEDLDRVFFEGYVPGGIDLREVSVDGRAADYGFQGEDECALRVACAIAPGASAVFEFDYYLLLTRCGAFVGVGDTDVRLTAFYFIPGVCSDGEFHLNKPLSFTRWLYSDLGDYEVTLSLPYGYALASTGEAEGGHIRATGVREFALCFGRRYRVRELKTQGGVTVRVFSGERSAGRLAEMAVQAIEHCEDWFGAFPLRELDIARSDDALGNLNTPGLMLIPNDLTGEALEMAIRYGVAQQIFGMAAYVEPSSDCWLSDGVCEYLAYLMLEADRGHEAFLQAVNRDWVADLQLTIPGGLRVVSEASLFTAREYRVVIRHRGAVVFHELRQAMGLEGLLEGFRRFYQMGQDGHTLTEMELVQAFDEATGGDWEAFLTDWVFNVGDYVEQTIDWFD